jgi:hypothetical protein
MESRDKRTDILESRAEIGCSSHIRREKFSMACRFTNRLIIGTLKFSAYPGGDDGTMPWEERERMISSES